MDVDELVRLFEGKRMEYGVVNVRGVVDELLDKNQDVDGAVNDLDSLLKDDDDKRAIWHFNALEAMRSLAYDPAFTADNAKTLLDRTKDLAWRYRDDEYYYKTVTVLARSTSQPVLDELEGVVRAGLKGEVPVTDGKWLALYVVGLLVTTRVPKNWLLPLVDELAKSSPDDPNLAGQWSRSVKEMRGVVGGDR